MGWEPKRSWWHISLCMGQLLNTLHTSLTCDTRPLPVMRGHHTAV
uniref:Uncharacterized protein n=1 Tax=Anguilla anguilla TaxID=7936 RepID=A0A0E9W8T3_ANGAN